MPANPKNSITAAIGTSATTIYTCPASTTATIVGFSLANITASQITVSVTVRDNSASVTGHLIKDAPIDPGGSLVIAGGDQKVVLEAADFIQVASSASASVDVVLSRLELS